MSVRDRRPIPPLLALLGLLVLGLIPSLALAQDTGSIGGMVVNGWDGRPLSGVIVTVRGTILAGTSDASGRYRLEGVPAGEHVVRFSKPGFGAATVNNVRVAPGLPSN
ncbi:MAG: carboxypeptidase regulatory-like domain-containing protein, partial [Verrucomicrobiales bacterium]|nr:carboxypeptidase regulatory-like domain-containing protein [Verrucomicrobiales bacterium]